MLVNSLPNKNGLLVALPPAVHDRLRPGLRRVRLEAGSTLYDISSTSDHTWFITSGIVSLLTAPEVGGVIEVATIGREGMVGFSGITKRNGIKLRAYVRVSGEALRIEAKTLQNMIEQESGFLELLFDYTNTLIAQMAVTGACNRFHKAEQRLARWLLTARDQVSSDSMALTQDDMRQMLGVSRSRIGLAVRALQKKGLIHYLRSHVRILNLERLEDAACGCNRAISRAIGWILPP
ncbi:MAG TPA: Crp/Fnr family transcriptional regulator [Blastocatellia bacterium]|nr:Crp/Fnr family transcriptional regulator [Blastocatellia bacterium]